MEVVERVSGNAACKSKASMKALVCPLRFSGVRAARDSLTFGKLVTILYADLKRTL